ncbi:Cytochrome C (fragment) [Cupriavidus oxalaticus]
MGFPGIPDARTRAGLVSYIEAISAGRVSAPEDGGLPSLRELDPVSRVTMIRYCGDAYRVTTADRKTHIFWEFNLRFKTDGSPDGPPAGGPALIGTGMQGDRATVVFARPEEISPFLQRQCP